MVREITSKRTPNDPKLYHFCPKAQENIGPSDCKGCEYFSSSKMLDKSYRINCIYPTADNLLQIEPLKASDRVGRYKGNDVVKSPVHTLVEPKLDGARAIIHCTPEGVFVTSRRRNKEGEFNQFQDNIPHIRDNEYLNHLGSVGYTIFDAEIIVNTKTASLPATMTVVGSSPEVAIKRQETVGKWATIIIFDILRFWDDGDIRQMELFRRRRYLESHLLEAHLWSQHIRLMPQFKLITPKSKLEAVHIMMRKGYEGAILKDPDSLYGDSKAWLKFKESMTVDALLTNWSPGKVGTKYEDTVGALHLSVLDKATDALHEIARVIPGDDATRSKWHSLLKDMDRDTIPEMGVVLELEGQQFSVHNRIRHPRILRLRRDLSAPNTIDFRSK